MSQPSLPEYASNTIVMKRFERVQKLSIARKNEKYISMLRFRNLKHLQLRSPFTLYHYDTYNINFDTITHLDICNDPSLDFIKRCKNLLSLDFAGVTDVDATFSLSQQFSNLECLPNLNHLALRSQIHVDTRIVLKDICNTLQSLAIYSPKHKVEGLTFTNLVDLYLGQASAKEIISIVETTKHLKRLNLMYLLEESDISYGLAFERMFELSTLEYVYIIHDLDYDIQISQLTRWIESSFR
eukprot:1151883_1